MSKTSTQGGFEFGLDADQGSSNFGKDVVPEENFGHGRDQGLAKVEEKLQVLEIEDDQHGFVLAGHQL